MCSYVILQQAPAPAKGKRGKAALAADDAAAATPAAAPAFSGFTAVLGKDLEAANVVVRLHARVL